MRMWFVFVVVSLLFLSSAAYAASSLSISANIGGSKVGDKMRIYVTYYDNASHTVANANCTMSGGFLSGPVSLSYNALDYYEYDLYLASAGSHTFSFSCSKTGVDSAAGTATINVPKGSSSLSLVGVPQAGEAGNKIYVQIQYQSGYSKISGASCALDVSPPEGAKDTITMNEEGSYYAVNYVVSSAGTYFFTASCTSDRYASGSQSFSMLVAKRKSVLSSSGIKGAYYAEQPIDVTYFYKGGDSATITNAKCNYEVWKKDSLIASGQIPGTDAGYVLSLRGLVQDNLLAYTLKATCESSEYSLQSATDSFYVFEEPTYVMLKNGLQKDSYSLSPLNLEAKYVASNTNREIPGATCTIRIPEENINATGHTLQTFLPAVDRQKTLNVEICCSKKAYKPSCASEYVSVLPQPISIALLPAPPEFIAGEEYRVGVSAAPAYYGKPDNISCRLDARSANNDDAPAKNTRLARTGAEHSAYLSFERAGSWDVTYTCSGRGYQPQSLKAGIRVKVFNKSRESALVTVLSALALVLSGALIIIRRKYKV